MTVEEYERINYGGRHSADGRAIRRNLREELTIGLGAALSGAPAEEEERK